MKKMKLLAMFFVALTVFACSKEGETNHIIPENQAVVSVKITGQGEQMGSKAVGVAGDDAMVKDFAIFLFNDGGGLIGKAKYVIGVGPATVENATTSATQVYVVTNIGNIENSKNPLYNVKSLADLKTRTGNLVNADTLTQTKAHLWMVGTGSVGKFTLEKGKLTANVTVGLSFLSARIDVIVKDQRTHTTPGNGVISIKDDSVALLFAGDKGKFFAEEAKKVEQTTFLSGLKSTTVAPLFPALLANKVAIPFTVNASEPGTVEYHFYTFGNNGNTKSTILTIKSTRTNADGTMKAVYYPVHFSLTDAGETIVPGHKYTVTLTLKGEVNAGGGGGITDPETEMKPADIVVSITPAVWIPKTISKEFN